MNRVKAFFAGIWPSLKTYPDHCKSWKRNHSIGAIWDDFSIRFLAWLRHNTDTLELSAWNLYGRGLIAILCVLVLVAINAAISDAPLVRAEQERAELRDASMGRLDDDLTALCERMERILPQGAVTFATPPPLFLLLPNRSVAPERCSNSESTRP